jgi:hypothetical protein
MAFLRWADASTVEMVSICLIEKFREFWLLEALTW